MPVKIYGRNGKVTFADACPLSKLNIFRRSNQIEHNDEYGDSTRILAN